MNLALYSPFLEGWEMGRSVNLILMRDLSLDSMIFLELVFTKVYDEASVLLFLSSSALYL